MDSDVSGTLDGVPPIPSDTDPPNSPNTPTMANAPSLSDMSETAPGNPPADKTQSVEEITNLSTSLLNSGNIVNPSNSRCTVCVLGLIIAIILVLGGLFAKESWKSWKTGLLIIGVGVLILSSIVLLFECCLRAQPTRRRLEQPTEEMEMVGRLDETSDSFLSQTTCKVPNPPTPSRPAASPTSEHSEKPQSPHGSGIFSGDPQASEKQHQSSTSSNIPEISEISSNSLQLKSGPSSSSHQILEGGATSLSKALDSSVPDTIKDKVCCIHHPKHDRSCEKCTACTCNIPGSSRQSSLDDIDSISDTSSGDTSTKDTT